MATLIVAIALPATFAAVFYNPRLTYAIVRCIVTHRRDVKAARALRAMRYTDIRREVC